MIKTMGELLNLLHFNQPAINATIYQQLLMSTSLCNLASLQNNDFVSMPDGAKPVRNNDTGPVLHHFIDCILDQSLTFRIE